MLAASLLLLPLLATVYNSVDGQRAASAGVADREELILDKDRFSYENRSNLQLVGKVQVIQYIVGRLSAKEKNANLIEVIKAVSLSHDRHQTTTVVSADDAISGIGIFARSNIESDKKLSPWSQFIVDSNELVRKARQLDEESSAIAVLDKDGRVKWAKGGALTQQEVRQVVSLLHKLLNRQRLGSRG